MQKLEMMILVITAFENDIKKRILVKDMLYQSNSLDQPFDYKKMKKIKKNNKKIIKKAFILKYMYYQLKKRETNQYTMAWSKC